MASNQENNLEFKAIASVPKVTDCVGWEDHLATGHSNSFIKLWKYDQTTKKMQFVLRFRHLSDSEDVEVFNEDAEEAPSKKKSLQEPITKMMLFYLDAQEQPSNLLDRYPSDDPNPIIQQIKDILEAKTKTATTLLFSIAGSELQLWNKKGEGKFEDVEVEDAVIVGDQVFAEPPEGEGELASETLLFGPPDSFDGVNVSHTFGFFAAERSRQLWATSEKGLTVNDPKGNQLADININEVLKKKGIPAAKDDWISPSLCEWNKYVVVSGWDHGVHLWNAEGTTLAHYLPDYNKENPARKVFTWKGYLCVSVSAKGNDRIDFWKDGPLTKVGTWYLAGGNSDMEAKFFDWQGYLCALQYKTLTLYDCTTLPAIQEDRIQTKPQVYQKGSDAVSNNNNNKKKKKTNKKNPKKRAAKPTNNKNPKKSKSSVDKVQDEDEYEDEFEDEDEEEPEAESSEYEEEEEEDSD